jgi:hypothetical protein
MHREGIPSSQATMSHLREIMQKLGAGQPVDRELTLVPASNHLETYRLQLNQCSSAMLQYEWTWLQQHLEDLQLCASHAGMVKAAGGAQHVRQLIHQAEACAQALSQEFADRNLRPERQPHSVATGEHAWEVSNAAIRSCWGLDAKPQQLG